MNQEPKIIPQPKNIDKATKDELKSIILAQNSRISMLEKTISEMEEFSFASGTNLILEPFIPEYCGFSTSVVEYLDCSSVRTFSKDGYVMFRDGDSWFVNSPINVKYVLRIDNMLEGVTVLRAIGVKIEVMDVVMGKFVEVKG